MKKILILILFVVSVTSCVSKHPKCAAYDKCENSKECVK